MAEKPQLDGAKEALTQEIARLKDELDTMREALSEHADDAMHTARRAAHAVAQPIRANPGTSGLLVGGLLGLLVGLAIGQIDRQPKSWIDRYR